MPLNNFIMATSKHIQVASEDDMKNLLANKYCKSTEKQTKYALNIFNSFMKKTNKSNISLEDKKELDDCLTQFFASLTDYKKTALDGIRYGLKRHFHQLYGYDIVHDVSFTASTEMYKCAIKRVKQNGNGYIKHYPQIEAADINRIICNLDTTTPAKLQLLVWFYIQIYFFRRANENSTELKTSDFKIETTADGREFLWKVTDELQKNHRQTDTEHSTGDRMYATKTSKCPVEAFRKYVSKLNSNYDRLWQQPICSFNDNSSVWYTRPIGKNTLSKFMSQISRFACLSKTYSNHSVRVTSCTLLGRKFEENDIKTVSGHKSNAALGIYKRVSEERRGEMSDCISAALSIINEPTKKRGRFEIPDDGLDQVLVKMVEHHESMSYSPQNIVIHNQGTINIYNK